MPGQYRSELEDALSSPLPSCPDEPPDLNLSPSGTYCRVCIGLELSPLNVAKGDEV